MFQNYLIVLYISAIVFLYKPKLRDLDNNKLSMMIIPLFLFAALRGNGNGDYFAYIERGEYILNWQDVFNKDVGMEVGYNLIAYIVRLLKIPRQFVVIIMNTISLTCIRLFIKKYSNNWSVSLIVFLSLFFQFDMHAARMAVSIGITTLSFRYIERRNLAKFSLCIIVACLFHSSAIVSFLIYFLYGKSLSIEKEITILISSSLYVHFFGISEKIIRTLELLGLNAFSEKTSDYANSLIYGYKMSLFDPRILIGIVVLFCSKLFVRKRNFRNEFSENCVFIYILFMILFSEITFLSYRLGSYFYTYIMILLPEIIISYNDEFKKSNEKHMEVYYSFLILFSVLNIIYASKSAKYISVFETKLGLFPY